MFVYGYVGFWLQLEWLTDWKESWSCLSFKYILRSEIRWFVCQILTIPLCNFLNECLCSFEGSLCFFHSCLNFFHFVFFHSKSSRLFHRSALLFVLSLEQGWSLGKIPRLVFCLLTETFIILTILCWLVSVIFLTIRKRLNGQVVEKIIFAYRLFGVPHLRI